MKLYELPRDSWFTLCEEPGIPPESLEPMCTRYKLRNIDGMYSYVIGEDSKVYHFAAWTEVNQDD